MLEKNIPGCDHRIDDHTIKFCDGHFQTLGTLLLDGKRTD